MSDVHCPARIIVARHGEAEYETAEPGSSGGSLTLLGREQARELGERLRGERIAAVVCSELSRAVQTAEIAAGVLGLPVRVWEGLEDDPLAVLDDIADQFRGETVLVVSHAGVILALWGAIAPGSALGPADDEVSNCSSYAFENDADGWRPVRSTG
jgi:broad specificity phosphatase PhoE